MSTLFIADIHLCIREPAVTAGFLHFLRTRALEAQALYILGDLFDVWIGDDDSNPLHHEIASALVALDQYGIPRYFVHGNRDFLIGHRYAISSGMTLLPSFQIIEFEGIRAIILHGDTLCTDDRNYQRFRRLTHQYWLQRLFLSLPLPFRRCVANKMRTNSLHINAKKIPNIMDVNKEAVMLIMEHAEAAVMIHGHTHRPGIHTLPGARYRAVLGAWFSHGSVIEMTDKGIKLFEFPFCS